MKVTRLANLIFFLGEMAKKHKKKKPKAKA